MPSNTHCFFSVSTHSRLKAAGFFVYLFYNSALSFNTQPPEGGWIFFRRPQTRQKSFNTQPPEGGWDFKELKFWVSRGFQHTAA